MGLKLHKRLMGLMLLAIMVTSLEPASRVFAAGPVCAKVFSLSQGTQSLHELTSLRLMTYNLKNFFSEPIPGQQDTQAKPVKEIQAIADIVLEQSPDVMVVQEVQDLKTLEHFNTDYLQNQYKTFLIEGNDERGIDVGLLLKKSLAVETEFQSNKTYKWFDPTTHKEENIFSRDLPALIIREPGVSQPSLIVFANHGKSKRDRPGDPESNILRQAQLKAIAQITHEYATRYGQDTPMVVAGDFNTDVQNDPEIRPLKEEFADSFDVSPNPPTDLDRATHTFHPYNGPREVDEMDAIFVNGALAHAVKSAQVYRYRDANGAIKPLPRNFKEREKNPSDHFPVVVDIDIHPLLRGGGAKAVGQ